MKCMKHMAILLIGLALLGNGCASVSPSASRWPALERENRYVACDDANDGADAAWAFLYWALYCGGEALACH